MHKDRVEVLRLCLKFQRQTRPKPALPLRLPFFTLQSCSAIADGRRNTNNGPRTQPNSNSLLLLLLTSLVSKSA